MKLTGRFLIICSLMLLSISTTALPTFAETSIGFTQNTSHHQNTKIKALQEALAKEIGQPVFVRRLQNDNEVLDWLVRFRELDVAAMPYNVYKSQPAGTLLHLAEINLEQDKSHPLAIVTTSFLDAKLRDQWKEALVSLQQNTDFIQATTQNGPDSAVPEKKSSVPESPPESELTWESFPPGKEPKTEPAEVLKTAPATETSAELENQAFKVSSERILESLTDPPESVFTEKQDSAETGRIGLATFIRQVIAQNQLVKGKKAQYDIKKVEEEKTHAIFEPDFITSLELEENSQRNSAEESLNRLFSETYEERNWDYNASVQGLLPTGAQYNVGYNYKNLSNSVTRNLTGEEGEDLMFLGVSLNQPLLKDAWEDNTKTGIRLAEAETKAARHDYRQELMKIAQEAALAYWDYYQALETMKLREDSVRIAKAILEDNRQRLRTGKMSKIEVIEAMAGVANRESLVNDARHEIKVTGNHLRSLLALNPGIENLDLSMEAPAVVTQVTPNRQERVQKALAMRPDYLAALERLKQSDVRLAFAENQRWSELDLIASYGLNGLAYSSGDAWDQIADAEYDSWAVGLELTLPLQGGIDTRSELKKTQLEKKSLLWELKDIEVSLANEIDSAIDQLTSSAQQLELSKQVVSFNQQLLEVEKSRLSSGKGSSRLVLEKEDRYRVALEDSLESQVQVQTALIDLELAEGSILLNNDVEIMGRTE